MATDEQKVWSSPEIGNYNVRPKADAKPERPEESRRRVRNILGAANYDLLHSEPKTNTTTARAAFIQALERIGADKFTQSTTVTKEAQDLKQIAKDHGEPNLVKLYQEAIKEERQSSNYINAAFLKSIEVYGGGDFEKQQVIIIAGPSGVGKSKVRSEVIKEITQGELDKNADPALIDKSNQHVVVFVDGGIERETSQIRDLMNKASLKLGYAGVKDLEDLTTSATSGSKLKKTIEAAADGAGLHLVIPTTDPIRDFKPYMADNSKSEVSYVAISGNKDTIAQTSHNRAFAKIGDTFDPVNDIKKAPESKKPGLNLSLGPVDIGSFKFGTDNAIAGEAAYLKKQKEKKQKNPKLKDPVVLHVEKDLMFINVLPDKDEVGKMEQLLLTKRQYEAWKAGGSKGTRKREVEAWLQTNTSPALKDELITALPGYAPKPAHVVVHMESKVDDTTEKRLQESRDAATQLKENIPPRVIRQNTKIEPPSMDSSTPTPSPAPKLNSKPK